MTKLVYLTEEQVETLLTVASRIDLFQHKSDAALIRNMVEVSE